RIAAEVGSALLDADIALVVLGLPDADRRVGGNGGGDRRSRRRALRRRRGSCGVGRGRSRGNDVMQNGGGRGGRDRLRSRCCGRGAGRGGLCLRSGGWRWRARGDGGSGCCLRRRIRIRGVVIVRLAEVEALKVETRFGQAGRRDLDAVQGVAMLGHLDVDLLALDLEGQRIAIAAGMGGGGGQQQRGGGGETDYFHGRLPWHAVLAVCEDLAVCENLAVLEKLNEL